jgi:Cthe_2314-like HEPN
MKKSHAVRKPMPLEAQLQALIARAQDPLKIPEQHRRERIELYGQGILYRIMEVRLTCRFIQELGGKYPQPEDRDKIHLYSDSFWAFARSSFDILGQILNQTQNLGINESGCHFGTVVDRLKHTNPADALTLSLDAIYSRPEYRDLNSYRNCSLHRRQVYLEGRKTEKDYGTSGYSTATGAFIAYEWILCDDPLVVIPTVIQGRRLIQYCSQILTFLQTEIENIIITLIP